MYADENRWVSFSPRPARFERAAEREPPMLEPRRPSLGALTPGSAQQLVHRAPTTEAKKPRLASSSEDAGRNNNALAATPSHSCRRESGIELHMLPSQDLRNMSANGKRFGFTREQWSAWRCGDQFDDEKDGDRAWAAPSPVTHDHEDWDGDWDGGDGGEGEGGEAGGEGSWDEWQQADQQPADAQAPAEAAGAKAGAVSGGVAFWTPACANRWSPEEWLQWSLGKMDDAGVTSRASQPTTQPSRGGSPSPSPEVEAFGVRGVLEARRGPTPSAHKGEGRAAHR